MSLFRRLDTYGTDDPDFNEGHPEDRCPVCDWPVTEHLVGPTLPDGFQRAKWPHRRAALVAIVLDRVGLGWP